MVGRITVRTAEPSDLSWLVQNDGHLDASTLAVKVEGGEVLLAEVDGESTVRALRPPPSAEVPVRERASFEPSTNQA